MVPALPAHHDDVRNPHGRGTSSDLGDFGLTLAIVGVSLLTGAATAVGTKAGEKIAGKIGSLIEGAIGGKRRGSPKEPTASDLAWSPERVREEVAGAPELFADLASYANPNGALEAAAILLTVRVARLSDSEAQAVVAAGKFGELAATVRALDPAQFDQVAQAIVAEARRAYPQAFRAHAQRLLSPFGLDVRAGLTRVQRMARFAARSAAAAEAKKGPGLGALLIVGGVAGGAWLLMRRRPRRRLRRRGGLR